jgi:oligopeptide/dipeptide ABC transporter ATP-binding protein
VQNLKVYFEANRGLFAEKRFVKAVDDVSFEIGRGETLSIVGESGCGKTTTARSIVSLVKPTAGSIFFDGVSATNLRGSSLKKYRERVQFIFQDPYESLNPRQTIFDAIATPIRIHGLAKDRHELAEQVNAIFRDVNLDPARTRAKFPFQLSGGQRQRVNIGRALATRPELIIADEPVSMLDVSLRLGILALLDKLKRTRGLSFLFITHDMAAARQVSDRIAVMYLGRIVEVGKTEDVIERPIHPYTRLLVEATPRLEEEEAKPVPESISKGTSMPSAINLPTGCRFRTRCQFAVDKCATTEPWLLERRPGQMAACDVVPV